MKSVNPHAAIFQTSCKEGIGIPELIRGLLAKMHEFGITSRIMGAVLRVAEENRFNMVARVDLLIGQLTFLDVRQVKMCYAILAKGTILQGSELAVQEIGGLVRCQKCGSERAVEFQLPDDPNTLTDRLPLFACTECGGKVEVIKGKECQVTRIAFFN